MRGTALILALLGLSFSGCIMLESAAKLATDAALAAVKAEIPAVKEIAHKGIEMAGLAAAEKSQAALIGIMKPLLKRLGVDLADYDFDGDGIYSNGEIGEAISHVEGKGIFGAAGLGILALLFTGLKTVRRYINLKLPPEGTADPPPPPPAPKTKK